MAPTLLVPSAIQFYVPFQVKVTGLQLSDWQGGLGYGATSSGGNGKLPPELAGPAGVPGFSLWVSTTPFDLNRFNLLGVKALTLLALSVGPWDLQSDGSYVATVQILGDLGIAPYNVPDTYVGPAYVTINLIGFAASGASGAYLIQNLPVSVIPTSLNPVLTVTQIKMAGNVPLISLSVTGLAPNQQNNTIIDSASNLVQFFASDVNGAWTGIYGGGNLLTGPGAVGGIVFNPDGSWTVTFAARSGFSGKTSNSVTVTGPPATVTPIPSPPPTTTTFTILDPSGAPVPNAQVSLA